MDQVIDISAKEKIIFQGKVGDKYNITVGGNPSTGYNWYLDPETYNENVVICTNKTEDNSGEYISANSNGGPPLCGAPGKIKFIFKFVKAGDIDIKIIYKRSWEENIMNEKIIVFNCA